jgi:mannosyltransferase
MATRALTAPATRGFAAADVLVVGVAAVVTLALVLPSYARRPFWFDELASVEIAGLGPSAFVDYVLGVESNMALYHGVLALWLQLGSDEAWTRLPSIVFALATLPFLFALGRRLFDRTTAAFAVALMCVNVSYVGYARDARSYALVLLLVTASFFFLVRGVQDVRPRDWTGWAVLAALAVWAHLLAALVVVAQVAWLFIERDSVRRRQALVAVSGLGMLLLPLALAVLLGSQSAQLDWLERPGPQQLPGLAEWFVESRATLVVYFGGAVAALVVGARARERGPYTLLLLWLLVPPAVAFVASYLGDPVYLYRYFLICLPALVLLVAAGFARLRPLWLGIALTAVACALSIRTVETCRPDCKIRHDDWEAAVADLGARVRPGDAIVVYPEEVRTPLDHYLGTERPRLLYPERWDLVGGATEGAESLGTAMQAVGEHPRVWLVTWWLPAEAAREALRSRATLVDAREFQGNVHVELYQSRRASR